jgi:hypothetical protein
MHGPTADQQEGDDRVQRQRRRRGSSGARRAADRDSRRAKKLKAARLEEVKALVESTPPGITFWVRRTAFNAKHQPLEIWLPPVKPLASCETDLDDEDVLALIRLGREASMRGLLAAALPEGTGPRRRADPRREPHRVEVS